MLTVKNPNTNKTFRFSRFTPDGRVLESTEPDGVVATSVYNARGRVTEFGATGEKFKVVYDVTGQLVEVIPPAGPVAKATLSEPLSVSSAKSSSASSGTNPREANCSCPGGVWEQDWFDPQFSAGAIGYGSVGSVNYTCASKRSITASANQVCLGLGPIATVGGSLNISGKVWGANTCRSLGGWSHRNLIIAFGVFGTQTPTNGPGGNLGAGPSLGFGVALASCLTYFLKCTGCDCSDR
jgi:hypothetical protein